MNADGIPIRLRPNLPAQRAKIRNPDGDVIFECFAATGEDALDLFRKWSETQDMADIPSGEYTIEFPEPVPITLEEFVHGEGAHVDADGVTRKGPPPT